MRDRPSRKCESRFRRSENDVKTRRKSASREQIVAGKRQLGDSLLKTPIQTRVAPVSFTPNPTLAPNPSTKRISISPLGLPIELPPELATNWNPSPVVGRKPTPVTVSPLWKLNNEA